MPYGSALLRMFKGPAGPAQPINRDVSEEWGDAPPKVPRHPAWDAFPEYPRDQAESMWQRLSPTAAPTAATPGLGTQIPAGISELNRVLGGGR